MLNKKNLEEFIIYAKRFQSRTMVYMQVFEKNSKLIPS